MNASISPLRVLILFLKKKTDNEAVAQTVTSSGDKNTNHMDSRFAKYCALPLVPQESAPQNSRKPWHMTQRASFVTACTMRRRPIPAKLVRHMAAHPLFAMPAPGFLPLLFSLLLLSSELSLLLRLFLSFFFFCFSRVLEISFLFGALSISSRFPNETLK